jgi:hypothetical protein
MITITPSLFPTAYTFVPSIFNLVKKYVWVREWLSFNANSAIFLAISWREQVNFQWDDDEVRFALDQHAELNFYSDNSLKQQSTDRHVAPLGHIILISSQPVFALIP